LSAVESEAAAGQIGGAVGNSLVFRKVGLGQKLLNPS